MSNPEQLRCINPKCKEPLFTPTANRCHKCFTIQQQLPEHQQTAPSGPGPPTASQLPSGSVDRQSGTHTDPSQYVHPPPSGPGRTQYSGSQQGNRDGSGGVSGDTNKEQFFDAQPVLPQTARPYHHEGHPPSSQPNIPQRYQYPQVFGMPHQQQTAPSGPGPPTASQLPLGPEDRQSRTHTDPSQHVHPPPSGPGIQYSRSQEGKRYVSGSESGDTNKEQFFDAQSVLPQSQTAMARPYDYRGPPPSSQPNVPQTYQYPQVFGMPPSRGPGSEGTPMPLFAPGGQVPYPPLPPGIQVPQGGHLAWLPSIQQFILIPHGYIGMEHPGFSPQASSQMVHGQISPQSMPYHQPHTSQPQSPRSMLLPQPPTSQLQSPSSVGMPYHQPHTSQPQSPGGMPLPQPPTSQSQSPSSVGMPYHQPHTSQPQSPGGMPLPQPPTSQSQSPSSVGMPYHQPHTSQPQSPGGMPLPQPPTSQPQSPRSMPLPQPPTSQSQSPRSMPLPQPPTSQSQSPSSVGMPYHQPHTSQPQSPRSMPLPQPPTSQSQSPSSVGMPYHQPHTSQPQSPGGMPLPQPPTSQSQLPSSVGMPYHQPHTSQPQSPGGMPLPQPPTSQSQAPSSVGMPYHQPHTSQPQSPSSMGIVSPPSHSSQPQSPSSTGHSSQSQPSSILSPQLNTSHPPPETHPPQPSPSQSSLQLQSPTGSAPLHQQPTGAAPPRISTQSSQESGTILPQEHETDSQMQVSTSVSPKPESFPPPSSHPSAASSIPATSSTEKFQATDPPKQQEQDKHFSDHNGTSKGTNGGKVPDKGNSSEQSSTQAQPTNTQPKTATSFTDTSGHPLQGTSDSTKKSSEQGSDANNKGPRKRSTDSDDSGRIPAKLAKQDDTKKEHNKEPSNDKDAKGGASKQLSEEPPKDKQPEKPVSQHKSDSQTGSATSAAGTKEVSLVVYTVISCFIKVPNSLECAV